MDFQGCCRGLHSSDHGKYDEIRKYEQMMFHWCLVLPCHCHLLPFFTSTILWLCSQVTHMRSRPSACQAFDSLQGNSLWEIVLRCHDYIQIIPNLPVPVLFLRSTSILFNPISFVSMCVLCCSCSCLIPHLWPVLFHFSESSATSLWWNVVALVVLWCVAFKQHVFLACLSMFIH